jgi:hypothetical protein
LFLSRFIRGLDLAVLLAFRDFFDFDGMRLFFKNGGRMEFWRIAYVAVPPGLLCTGALKSFKYGGALSAFQHGLWGREPHGKPHGSLPHKGFLRSAPMSRGI